MPKAIIISILILSAVIFYVEGLSRLLHRSEVHASLWLPGGHERPSRALVDDSRTNR